MASSEPLAESFTALGRALDRELWVVTAAHDGRRGGLLATSVSVASIVPSMPRVLVGIGKSHHTWGLIVASSAFACHLVSAHQGDLASHFALHSGRNLDKLADQRHTFSPIGNPLLTAAPAWLDCRVEARFDAGDRTLFLGQVVDARPPGPEPLLTAQRWFPTLTDDQRQTLAVHMRHDAEMDAQAIEAWRSQGRRD